MQLAGLPGIGPVSSKRATAQIRLRSAAHAQTLDRPPSDADPNATSIPGVFAIGDVRAGSTKRVAAAVGEGAAVVTQLHAALAFRN